MCRLIELQNMMGHADFVSWLHGNIICAILHACVDLWTFTQIFDIKITKGQTIKYLIVDSICKSILSTFIPAPFYRLVAIFTTIFLMRVILKAEIEKCVIGETINKIFTISFESIFMRVYYNMFDGYTTYTQGMYNFRYKTTLILTVILLKVATIAVVQYKKAKIPIIENPSKKTRNAICIVAFIGVMLVFFNFTEMAIYISNFPYIILLIDLIALTIYYYMGIKYILRSARLEEQNLMIKNLETYNYTLTIMYDSLRCFKHDFSNFVQALDGYVKIDDINGIKKMSSSILKECKSVNNLSLLNPKTINNPAIYSILTNKYYLANENSIMMKIEVGYDLQNLTENIYEICGILGILMDNALEAAIKSEEKIVNVKFGIDHESNHKYIVIENSYLEDGTSVEEIYEKGFTTKQDAKDHGLGLWNVKRTIAHTNMLDLETSKGKMFSQRLIIKDKVFANV